ncbi:histidinol-phosphate aminotransferase [Leptolyngbya sp. 'hensonii']|uniref:histidinol-phosphate transaminase n=1 Tax=Leptolyngbya sp. 'hensonii' TaxID=1922337 RepID=UPI00095032A3|nr:histidinol-phosphate transaminase [Leptolyngbya sp. 'hensonii']OLP17157.1 histidinol-phosphate aminotransferase [Leptolyngbya sp. 'hensonii']
MLPFLRSDLAQFQAYAPHPGGEGDAAPAVSSFDRLDTNESPYQLPEELKQKLTWTYQHLIETNRYPDGGHHELKQAIAGYVNESAGLVADSGFTPAQISVGNGSDELIRSLLIATCLRGEGSILVAEPTFSMYGILAETLGVPVVRVGRSETDFALDRGAATRAMQQTQQPPIRTVFVVHPNSPTANTLQAAELDWLRALPEQVLVVIDEAYFEFSGTTIVAEVLQRPNWVVLRTFSKAFRLAAHRVGYAIAHPELTAALEKIRLPYNLPSMTQVAALLALNHRQQLLTAIPLIRRERDQLLEHLAQELGLQVWPSQANFIFVRPRLTVPDPGRSTALSQAIRDQLKARGTLVRQISGGLRITIGSPEENQRTLLHLREVLRSRL